MKLFTLWLPKYSFSLAVMMALLVIILTPLNQLGLSQYNIERTLPENKVEFVGRDKSAFMLGERLALYRFNPEWEKPITEVEIEAYENGKWVARFDPHAARWPVGNQGTIIRVDAQKNVFLNVGQGVGVKAGDTWNIFEGSDIVGKLLIQTVHANESTAQLVKPFSINADLVGLQVSPYVIVNQIIVFDGVFIRVFQLMVLLAALVIWVWSICSEIPTNLWFAFCQSFKHKLHTVPADFRFRLLVISGVPISYGLGALFWNMLCHVNWTLQTVWLNELVEHYPTVGIAWVQIIFAAAWYAVLFGMLRSPMSYLVEKIQYKPLNFSWFPGAKPYFIWLLHLMVYYAFTNTLGQVAVDNMQVMVDHAWPDFRAAEGPLVSPVLLPWMDFFIDGYSSSKHVIDRFWELLLHMSTHSPVIAEPIVWFVLLRLSMWSVTICVCLCLYTYTVICILWTRSAVKNIDFTIAGWVTTAVCYGPLLGDPLHHTIPSAHGLDPTYISDFWMWFVLSVEMLLNLLYMLSIFNLGLMFGVLVDKGVRTRGFYAVIRHPNYTLEALMFVVMGLTALSDPVQWFAISIFLLKYWLRSEREDQFMSCSNPEYVRYKTQTPWKFIPGLY